MSEQHPTGIAKTDPRRARSRQAMIDAITSLLDAAALAAPDNAPSIGVSEVVRAAGVSRPTFYEHFGDLGTLMRAAALARLEASFTAAHPPGLDDDWPWFTRGAIRGLIQDLVAHVGFFRLVLAGPGGAALRIDVTRFVAGRLLDISPLGVTLERRSGPESARDRAEFLAAGVVWHVLRWLETDEATAVGAHDATSALADRVHSLLLTSSGATEADLRAALDAAPPASDSPAPDSKEDDRS
ncbi:MAG: TetR/AcrR family transcriptional regulator [Pseudoclavibacter sp.]